MSPHKTELATNGTKEGRNWMMGREAFERRMPHHDGIQALWETKWKFPCSKSVYPFHDGAYEDFEPIFNNLIRHKVNDATRASYTLSFLPTAQRLTIEGDQALAAHNLVLASELYLRQAWEAQKEVYLKAGALWANPVREVKVEFKHRKVGEGSEIPVYVRVPDEDEKEILKSVRTPRDEDRGRVLRSGEIPVGVRALKGGEEGKKSPVVVLMTGLDGYRPDNTVRASVVVEIPGTADCPADGGDPESPDRLWTSLLEWMASTEQFDMKRVMVWGLSSGGYYAIRIAHTHKYQLIGCVAQGAGCHYFYDKEWLEMADGHEYPFQFTSAWAMKHGFDSVQEFKAKVQKKFSLLETGIIQKPSTRLLLINGTLDGLMPIEDSMMLFEYGTPKEARFFHDAVHMGYPMANASVYPWMEEVMDSVRN
ncbi:hypothetical protein N0V88_003454 [Collariella sp. IMI 366227]|nr:hypothetical protein N0V88_003454 [Collariella sp. IMI 366227]